MSEQERILNINEGMVWGTMIGSIVGTILTFFINILELPICMTSGMVIGTILGFMYEKRQR